MGAAVGMGYGACGALQDLDTHVADYAGAMCIGMLIGALMGAELYHSRSWNRFGAIGWYARWAIAGASAFGFFGSLLVLLGELPHWGNWAGIPVGALIGLCLAYDWGSPV
jgi:hypothetical protein